VDGSGNVYVANANQNSPPSGVASVEVFAAGANGNVAPIETIAGAKTKLSQPNGLALDGTGNIYVADYAHKSVTAYAAGATGNARPLYLLKGKMTTLYLPVGVAVQ
jgi:sugar lactone lactonase YvrE